MSRYYADSLSSQYNFKIINKEGKFTMKHMRMNIWRYAAAMLFCLAIAAGLTATALAKGQSSITYIDENGAEHKVTDYKILTYSDSDVYLQSGTYVTTNFGSDAETIRGIINIQGDVIIIIRNYLRFQGVWIQPNSSLTIYEEKGREATIPCNTIDGMAPEGFSGYLTLKHWPIPAIPMRTSLTSNSTNGGWAATTGRQHPSGM